MQPELEELIRALICLPGGSIMGSIAVSSRTDENETPEKRSVVRPEPNHGGRSEHRQAGCHREPGHQFAVPGAGPALQVHRRGDHHESSRAAGPLVLRPHPQPRKKKGSKQLVFDTEWTQDRIEENKLVNQIRARVTLWREGGYLGVTPTTKRLLAYWTDPPARRSSSSARSRPSKTAIYLTEVAHKCGDAWIENELRAAQRFLESRPTPQRFKMATGSGKTVVMAMLIAWHTLNKLAQPPGCPVWRHVPDYHARHHDPRPPAGLAANDPQNYYRQRDIVRASQ
jgi:hypothetical protein